MNHIRKQKWMGCAVATAAMVADLSYEDVAAHWPDLTDAQLRWPNHLCSLLESVTETRWQVSQCWYPLKTVEEFPCPEWPIAVFISGPQPQPRFSQWIVLKGEIVHDPGDWGPRLRSRYRLRDWLVTWTAQPLRPNDFGQTQARLHLHRLRNIL